jgi:hypothetical protein
VCDADVPPTAKACPECGACYESGWNDDDDEDEEIDYGTLDLPEEVYDEETKREIESRNIKRHISPKWRWVALVLVAMWLLYFWWTTGVWLPW